MDLLVEAIQTNDGAYKKVTLIVCRTTDEEANEVELRLGRALRNNTVVERITINNLSEELVSDISQYFTDVLYFLRHGPSLQHCVLVNLGSAWQSILHAAGANPSVKEIQALGLDRHVDDLRLEYMETLDLSFSESPQPWITDALYTASNLQKLTIRVNDTDPSWLIRVFEHLTSCPKLRSVSIVNRGHTRIGAYEMMYWIARNCPLLDRLDLFKCDIDAAAASLIRVTSLSLNDCALHSTPPPTILHLQVVDPRISRASQVTTMLLVQSQLRLLESFSWTGASNANAKSMVQSVLPQAQALRSFSIEGLELDGLRALFHSLPQYGTVRQLTVVVRSDWETDTRFGESSQIVLNGLRGNGSLTSIHLHLHQPVLLTRQNLFPEASATYREMNRCVDRNEKLPCVLHNQEVCSPLVPSLLFTALEAPKTGISLVAKFLRRYN